jgi:SH3 domain
MLMVLFTVVQDGPVIIGYCRALYDYSARNQRELSFRVDDIITITSNKGLWWKGELDGRVRL